MAKTLGLILLVVGCASMASATAVPEIDAGTAVNGIALLSGAVLIFRASRRRR